MKCLSPGVPSSETGYALSPELMALDHVLTPRPYDVEVGRSRCADQTDARRRRRSTFRNDPNGHATHISPMTWKSRRTAFRWGGWAATAEILISDKEIQPLSTFLFFPLAVTRSHLSNVAGSATSDTSCTSAHSCSSRFTLLRIRECLNANMSVLQI